MRNFWQFLTEPAAAQQTEERRQAQLLSILLLVLAPAAPLAAIVPALLDDGAVEGVSVFIAVNALLITCALFVLSRTRYYRLASLLTIVLTGTAIFAAIITDSSPTQNEAAFYPLVAVLLSSFLLSMRATVIVTLLQAVILMALPVLGVVIRLADPFIFYLVMSLLVLLFTHQRNRIERARRAQLAAGQRRLETAYADLENRVAERTAELSQLNDQLRAEITDRARADAALIEERNLLRTLIENLPDIVFVLDTESRYILNNAEHRRLLGVQTMEEIVGKHARDFFPPEEAARFDAEEQALILAGQSLLNQEESYLDPHGQQHWGLISKIPFRDTTGQVVGVVGVLRDITDLKRAETVLRQAYRASKQQVSEQKLELSQVYNRLLHQANLLENVSEAIVSFDTNGLVQSWNRAAENLFGYEAAEVLGRSAWELLAGILTEEQPASLKHNLSTRQPWQGEISYTRENGRRVHYLTSVSHVYDHEQQVIGVVAVSRDMTEQKQMEAAERNQRQLAEALRDTAATINATLELEEVLDRIFLHIARIVPCDTANISMIKDGQAQVVRYWGTLEEEGKQAVFTNHFNVETTLTLKTMIETGHPLFIPDTDSYPGWVRKSETNFRSYIGMPIRIQDKVIGFLNASARTPNAFNESHLEGMTAFGEQLATALRNAQLYETIRHHAAELVQHVADRTAELERQRTQLQIILDSMSEGVVSSMVTEAGVLQPIYLNEALKRLLGYDLADWREHLVVYEIMADTNPALYQQIFEAIMQQGRWQGETRLRRKDGLEFQAHVCSTRIANSNGIFTGVVTVIRDVSQEKALEEQRSRFVANASHELRTPITNLMTRLWLLRKQPERLNEHLEILENVANRMRYLVQDLLDVSRLERGVIPIECAPMDLKQTITEVIDTQRAEADSKNVHLVCELSDDPLMIWGDARRINQVITNLVMNAINYTPAAGRILVDSTHETDSDNGVRYVIIHIQDTGVGIPPEHLPHLFQPFYRVGEQGNGTGLGLAIAKEIIELHGGTIHVSSEVGAGSRFSIRLPLWSEPPVSGSRGG